MTDERNGRTHDPTFRELVVELDGLRALLDERDRRYSERDAANKAAVAAALASSEKAGEKVEAALKEYKVASNEWRDTVNDFVRRMPSRQEVDQAIKTLTERISDLRETQSARVGTQTGTLAVWGYVITILVTASAVVLAIIAVVNFLSR
jgi:CHASE3 domain sensor protein